MSRQSPAFPFQKSSAEVPDPFDRPRALSEKDAIEIWIARWLRVRRKDIVARYACDPRRIYEIWEGARFPAARTKALDVFSTRYPQLVGQFDASHHKRLPLRTRSADQLSLFS
ncbi:MAG: hypothetical protein NW216_02050 [Hyphomicrobium sp.]|nr:hypothetical protein [Hyphomicrobium sp.]